MLVLVLDLDPVAGSGDCVGNGVGVGDILDTCPYSSIHTFSDSNVFICTNVHVLKIFRCNCTMYF